MTRSYEELLTELCAVIGFNEPKRLIACEPIFINDVMFSLIHDEQIDPARIFVFATFGHLPGDNATSVMERLLKENHACFDGHGCGFSVSPTTGKVIYALQVSLEQTNPVDLANRMGYLAQIANQWRKTFFLNQPSSSDSPASRRPHFNLPGT